MTSRRIRKALDSREDTKPYNPITTITKQIRRNRKTRKYTTKHNGSYSRTRRNDVLRNNSDPKSRTDEANHRIPKWGIQKVKSQGTRGLPRRGTQTMRLASPAHCILQNSGMARRPRRGKNPICNKPPKGRRRNLDHTIRRRTNHPNLGHLGRIQSRIRKTIWCN